MAQLAIKGHSTRGKEVIEILEMLGGKISHECGYEDGFDFRYVYFIDTKEKFFIDGYLRCLLGDEHSTDFSIFTLEEFLEKFPYKIKDRVKIPNCDVACRVTNMIWNGVEIEYETTNSEETFFADELQPYKKETMKDYLVTEEDYEKTLEVEQKYIDAAERLIEQLSVGTRWKCKDFDSQKMIALFLKKNTSIITEKENSIIVDIPKGYEFAGVDDNNQQVVFEKIGCQYPKTYEECCKIRKCDLNFYIDTHLYSHTLSSLYKLIICRDAYLKLAGEEMGLDKPWEPDWNGFGNLSYPTIVRCNNRIIKTSIYTNDCILVFPTAEMRDAFYENFNELIEECKVFI